MAHLYVESSALVKEYVAEPESEWLRAVLAPSDANVIHTPLITGAEVIAAIARRARDETVDLVDATRAIARFTTDFSQRYQRISITEAVVRHAMQLAAQHGMRGYDSIQLTAARSLQSVRTSLSLTEITFVSADVRLNTIAVAQGLRVENPVDHR
jgi:predicted nucleic acid-binding protein